MTAVDTETEQRRLIENRLFQAWEDGFRAGHSAAMDRFAEPKNPYQWHGKPE